MNVDRKIHQTVPLAVLGWLFFTVGVSLPSTIYSNNAADFSITLSGLLLVAICAWLLCMTVSAVLIWLVPIFRATRLVAALFAFTLMIWIQGHLLVWQYGPLDGRPINWAEHTTNGFIDSPIWLLLLALSVLIPRPFVRAAMMTALIVTSLEMTITAVQYFDVADEISAGSIKRYQIDESSKFVFSKERNVVLIILDETQSDVVGEIFHQDPTYAEIFDGFTYFQDAVAGSNYTELAVPALLTGQAYDNSHPKDEYMRQAFVEKSIFAELSRANFRVDIFPWVGWGNESIYFDPAIAANLRPVEDGDVAKSRLLTEGTAKELIHLLDLTLFRCAPHFLKVRIYNNQDWLLMRVATALVPSEVKESVSTDDEYETTVFARDFVSDLRIGEHPSSFKYYHLKGAHSPLTVHPDLSVGSATVPLTRDNYVLQIKASVRGLARVFDAMRKARLFDQTMIIVTGDHGSGNLPELYVESAEPSDPQHVLGAGQPRRNFRRDKARAQPVLLIKTFDAAGPLRIDNRLVSVMDIGATIAAELGIPTAQVGNSVFHPDESATRTRHFGAFDFSATKSNYVGPITLYDINGPVRDDRSWSVNGILWPAAATDRRPRND